MGELAYGVWVSECSRSSRRTAARLRELIDDDTRAPSHQAVSGWARSHGWDVKADAAIAGVAPNLRGRQLARLVDMGNAALDAVARVMAGDYDHMSPAAIQARVSVAVNSLERLSLGTAASKSGPVTIPVPAAPVDGSSMSPVELARVQRERPLDQRGA